MQELASAFGVEAAQITSLRRQGVSFSCVDVATLITGKERNYAGQQIRLVKERYPEVQDRFLSLKFPGRGQRETPVGDIYAIVELIMLLPGRRAGLVRSNAARLFVNYYGGNLSMAEGVIANRERQDELELDDPTAPARAFGRQVESEQGSTDEQRAALSARVVAQREENEQLARRGGFDPTRLTEADHTHKDEMVQEFIHSLLKAHECASLAEVPGCVAILDDFGRQQGVPRVASIMTSEGFPAERILSPNRDHADVVDASLAMNVRAVKKEFTRALDEDFAGLLRETPLAGAYIDACTGTPSVLTRMVDAVRAKPRRGAMAVAYTIVERDFTPDGKKDFTKRVLEVADHMRASDFAPHTGELSRSYETPRRPNGRCVGTAFWLRSA